MWDFFARDYKKRVTYAISSKKIKASSLSYMYGWIGNPSGPTSRPATTLHGFSKGPVSSLGGAEELLVTESLLDLKKKSNEDPGELVSVLLPFD